MRKTKDTAFFKGTVALSVSVIIIKIIGVAFKVPLSYVLGDEGMGYFNTAYAIYGFFYILCTAGVPKSIALLLAGHGFSGEEKPDDGFVIKSALGLFARIGIIATLINIICAPIFAEFIGNDGAKLSIIAIAPSILFVSLGGVLRGYLNSAERLLHIAISQLIEGVIKLLLGLLFAFIGVRMGASVSVISAMAIMGITVGSIGGFLYLILSSFSDKRLDNIRQKRIYERKKINILVLKNALPIALSSSLLNLSSTLDLTIIIKQLIKSGFSESYANSLYGNYTTLAVPMFTMVISVLSPIATSYMPRLSSMANSGDRQRFQSELNTLLLITLSISVPASLAFYFYSFDLLDVLFSVQSSAVGADMLICLSLGICLLSSLTVINTALESRGKIPIAVSSLLLGAVTKLVVSYALVGRPGIGVLGAPIGTVASYAVSLAASLFALEISGVKTYALIKCFSLYAWGIISFYPSYKVIYSAGTTGTSFTSMVVSLAVSSLIYVIGLLCLYMLLRNKRVFKLHKISDAML